VLGIEILDQARCFENTHALPQRVKACSVSGFALLSILERNRARSAFKRFSQSPSLIFSSFITENGMITHVTIILALASCL